MNNQETQGTTNDADPASVDRVVICPQPDWIRPASGGTDTWHGYCGSGPDEGLVCPFGVNGMPEEVDGVWYWVKIPSRYR